MPSPLGALPLYLRTTCRVLRRDSVSLRGAFRPLEPRVVFVLGSPRSGTTFLARAIGSLPGFVDLGEVGPLKAAIPDLTGCDQQLAAARIRRIVGCVVRLGLAGGLRPVEQTPETSFIIPAVREAFPEASFVHIIRDGRDVVCSLLERGWLSAGRPGGDDVGRRYGTEARFWVEPERREEFSAVSDARRAAWAWRRYVEAARSGAAQAAEVRYEALVDAPAAVAAQLSDVLSLPQPVVEGALATARPDSIGRHERELSPGELRDVQVESGHLLASLGYA
ncbi:MAG: sulfotransferase [Actinomycetia bacterium]|nr:sulfotransferase [Actinomycetes bacterium]